jgi:hypothetical protein
VTVALAFLFGAAFGLTLAAALVLRRGPSAHQPVQRVFTAPERAP